MMHYLVKLVVLVMVLGNISYAKMSPTQLQSQSKSEVAKVVKEAYVKYKNLKEGKNADYIKALAEVDPKLFGIVVVDKYGNVFEAGDVKKEVSIQSISKVFTLALVMRERGDAFVKEKIGVNATGLPFNSIMAIELHDGSASNPFVNAGAIETTSWVKARNSQERWKKIASNMSSFAGRKLRVNQEVYKSELSDNKRNQAIAKLLEAYGRMGSDPLEATTVYTKQCSISVSAHDLAVMSATIANHGINPVTKTQVIPAKYTPKIMAVMSTAGLYDNAGGWLYDTGLPAKSGVGGGIIAIVPGEYGIAVVSPPLDVYGNSVRAQKAIAYIVEKLGLNPYAK
ncbi:MAG: glutaminase A [Sulfurimonas sp.]